MVRQWEALVFLLLLVGTGAVSACVCPKATVPSPFPSMMPVNTCCLNLSGSALGHLHWSVFSNNTGLEILDLSHCNITQIETGAMDRGPSTLTTLFLNHNKLTSLPKGFLSGLFNLTQVSLEGNQLRDLPQDFLQDSDQIHKLNLRGNRLQFLRPSILQKPSLVKLDAVDNPWDCSCEFLEEIVEVSRDANRTAALRRLLANLTCASPPRLAGLELLGLSAREACHPTELTALFIVLPLLILSALVLCWCCGRKKSKKEVPGFSAKKKGPGNHSIGQKPRSKPPPASDQTPDPQTDSILQNQLLLRPSSALLSSTRDIYQEVEGRLGSVESLPQDASPRSSLTDVRLGSRGPEGTELDTVSVTEVMRDSADREKAYLTQSTEYYSLVPGLQLEDSDHGEYENVDLT